MRKLVAAKKMWGSSDVNQEGPSERMKEAALMSQVRGKNIVELIGVVTCYKKHEFMLMTLCEMGDLKKFLQKYYAKIPAVTDEFRVNAVFDIASGMAQLAKYGIVHRDLAARNVLVDGQKRCKVAEYGLAHKAQREDADPTIYYPVQGVDVKLVRMFVLDIMQQPSPLTLALCMNERPATSKRKLNARPREPHV